MTAIQKRYYLLDGKTPVPCTQLEWLKNFSKIGPVGHDTIGPFTVSTVFLGVDRYCLNGVDPLLFETVIFTDKSEYGRRWRYPTYEEAETIHHKIVGGIKGAYAVPGYFPTLVGVKYK